MNYKAFARLLYATVPGVAAVRFAAKDAAALYFAKPEFDGIRRLSIGKGLIVDVGANRGQSIAAFKRLAPDSRIVAFEPEPQWAERLAMRYHSNENITVHGVALDESSGTVTLFMPRYGWWHCDGMAATDRKAAIEWLSDPSRMSRYNEARLTVEEARIECRTLDSFNFKPVVIKVHAQGAEFKILKGACQTIRQHVPALMCAFPQTDLIELLFEWGYRPYVFTNGHFASGIAKQPFTFTWFLADKHTDFQRG